MPLLATSDIKYVLICNFDDEIILTRSHSNYFISIEFVAISNSIVNNHIGNGK